MTKLHGNRKVFDLDKNKVSVAKLRKLHDDCWEYLYATCAKCDNPADILDHLYPYHSDMNICKKCLKQRKEKYNGQDCNKKHR